MEILNRIISLLGTRDQKELTDFLNLKKTAFTDWKSGKSNSYRKYLIEISEFFHVSLDYLVYGKESKETNLTLDEQELLGIYGKLANEKKKEAVRRIEELTTSTESENKFALSHNGISRTNGYEQELILNFRKLSLEEQMRLIGRIEVMAEMSETKEKIG